MGSGQYFKRKRQGAFISDHDHTDGKMVITVCWPPIPRLTHQEIKHQGNKSSRSLYGSLQKTFSHWEISGYGFDYPTLKPSVDLKCQKWPKKVWARYAYHCLQWWNGDAHQSICIMCLWCGPHKTDRKDMWGSRLHRLKNRCKSILWG